MKLYLLESNGSFIVVQAKDSKTARRLAAREETKFDGTLWRNATRSSCRQIQIPRSRKPGVAFSSAA